MLIDYNKFQIISLGGYQIDHTSNKKLLETLEDFCTLTKTAHLNYYLTGSICLSILTNKIYRTWKDIDILVDKDSMSSWMYLLTKNGWYHFGFNQKLMKFYHNTNNNYLELLNDDPRIYLYRKKNKIITDYNGIKIIYSKSILFWKKNFREKPRKEDFYDEILVNGFTNKV